MAVVIGTNAGFVTTAPVADPNGTNTIIDTRSFAVKDIAPDGYTKITEIGWWCDPDTAATDTNYEIGLYSHDAGNDKPATRLFVTTGLSRGTTEGWITNVVDWDLTPGVIYWIAVQADDTIPATNTNLSNNGNKSSLKSSSTGLTTPWGTSTEYTNSCTAFYALVDSGTEYVDIESTIGLTIGIFGTLTVAAYVDLESTIGLTIGVSGTVSVSVSSIIDVEAIIPISIGISGTVRVSTIPAVWPHVRFDDYDPDLYWDEETGVWSSTRLTQPGNYTEYVIVIGEEGEIYFKAI